MVALAEMAQRRLRDKIPQLQRALEGTEHHRFLLREFLEEYDYFEKKIASISERLTTVMPQPFCAAVKEIDPVAGIAERGARRFWRKPGST